MHHSYGPDAHYDYVLMIASAGTLVVTDPNFVPPIATLATGLVAKLDTLVVVCCCSQVVRVCVARLMACSDAVVGPQRPSTPSLHCLFFRPACCSVTLLGFQPPQVTVFFFGCFACTFLAATFLVLSHRFSLRNVRWLTPRRRIFVATTHYL